MAAGLLTRFAEDSDFGTDACAYKDGIEMARGLRFKIDKTFPPAPGACCPGGEVGAGEAGACRQPAPGISPPSCSICGARRTPPAIRPASWAMERSPFMSMPEQRDDPWNAGRGRVLLRIARESLGEALGIGMAADYLGLGPEPLQSIQVSAISHSAAIRRARALKSR
jgi:hypothetical protein